MHNPIIQHNITWEQIEAAKPDYIYHSAASCWWTHDASTLRSVKPVPPADPEKRKRYDALMEGMEKLYKDHPKAFPNGESYIKTDPSGCPLMQTTYAQFMVHWSNKLNSSPSRNRELQLLMACHDQNARIEIDGELQPYAIRTWQEAAEIIDK